MAAGPAGANARPRLLSRRLRDDPAARAARRAHRAGRGRRLDAGAGGGEGTTAASCRSMCCSSPRSSGPRRLRGDAQPGAAHGRRSSPSSTTCPASPRHFCADGKPPEAGAHAEASGARRHARASRACRASTTSTAATSAARLPPISSSIGSPVTRADLETTKPTLGRTAAARFADRHASTTRRRRPKASPR